MKNPTHRPVTVLGGGVLGRRIAAVFLATGYNVHTYDPSADSLDAAKEYVATHISEFAALVPSKYTDTHGHQDADTNGAVNEMSNGNRNVKLELEPGQYGIFTDLRAAVENAWLVIEAVPEILDLKTKIFGEVDAYAASDCVVVSNSSSYRSRLMMGKVSEERKKRVANMHFTMPPGIRTVELMTCGETEMGILEMLKEVLTECGMLPVIVRRECTGYVSPTFFRPWLYNR